MPLWEGPRQEQSTRQGMRPPGKLAGTAGEGSVGGTRPAVGLRQQNTLPVGHRRRDAVTVAALAARRSAGGRGRRDVAVGGAPAARRAAGGAWAARHDHRWGMGGGPRPSRLANAGGLGRSWEEDEGKIIGGKEGEDCIVILYAQCTK